jgi:DNA-binding NarL/FixJ family response regulator
MVIVQDYRLLRNALAERMNREPMIEVCAQTSSRSETCQLVEKHRPQIVLMNVSLKNPAGLSLLKRLKRNYKWLTVLTFSCDPEFEHLNAELAIHAGADGYVSSADDETTLVQAVHQAMSGEVYVSHHLNVRPKEHADEKMLFSRLSRREIEVFCLTGCGHLPKGIAEKLDLSVKTIESYRERIRDKMGLKDGAELLYAATSYMRRAVRRRSLHVKEHQVKAGGLVATLQQAG